MASRFLKPYYVCNVLMLISYAAVRVQRLDPGELGVRDILGFTREASVYISVVLVLLTRVMVAPTMDAYLATAFKVCTAAIALLLWCMDKTMMRIFLALYASVHVLCPQPRFAHASSISVLDANRFQQRVLGNAHKSFHVLWVHATWSPRCTQLAPVLGGLAARGEHPRVRFSKLDVRSAESAVERLGISTAPTSLDLPCVVLFRCGKEVKRVPGNDSGGSSIRHRFRNGFSEKQVWKEFDMDAVMEEAENWEESARQKLRAQEQRSGGKKVK